jgi:hypothetical protein
MEKSDLSKKNHPVNTDDNVSHIKNTMEKLEHYHAVPINARESIKMRIIDIEFKKYEQEKNKNIKN